MLLVTCEMTDTYSHCDEKCGNVELYISLQIMCTPVLGVNCYMTQIQESRVEVGKVQRLIDIQYKYTYL
jgi:hypothetical protein